MVRLAHFRLVLVLMTWCAAQCYADRASLRRSRRGLSDSPETPPLTLVAHAVQVAEELAAGAQDTLDAMSDEASEPEAPYSSGPAVPLEAATLKDQGKIPTIVGGASADPSEAHYFTLMLSYNPDNSQWEYNGCGGALLSNLHVLTAGHCVDGRDGSEDAVYVGAYQPFSGNPGIAFHYSKVAKYDLHPNFRDGPNDSDVAVVTMMQPVDLSKFSTVQLAPPSLTLSDGDMVSVYGFGRPSYYNTTQVTTLQTVAVPYISNAACRQIYGSRVLEDMFCAGYEEGGRDACTGDSGGPIVLKMGGTVLQIGTVSWGDGCADANRPGVYTSVQYHYEWIRSTVCSVESVDPSVSLCASELVSLDAAAAANAAPTRAPALARAPAPSSSSCNKKKEGEACFYGGQCCSGTCVRLQLSAATSTRACGSSTNATPVKRGMKMRRLRR